MSKDIKIQFQAKHPYTTWGIVLFYKKGFKPNGLIKSMKKLGWKPDPFRIKDEFVSYHGYVELEFYKDGTDLFKGWTPKENRNNMHNIKNLLSKNDISWTYKKLTLADLL